METAKVFWSGRSQAVRLPKEFRMDAKEVRLRKKGKDLILEPLPENWNWLDAIAGKLDEDFVQAIEEQPPAMEHADLAELFRP